MKNFEKQKKNGEKLGGTSCCTYFALNETLLLEVMILSIQNLTFGFYLYFSFESTQKIFISG